MNRSTLVIGILACSISVSADQPLAPPSRITRWSPNRHYCAVADPKRDDVAIYRVDGSNRIELWAVAPWQRSFDVADDGDHMVACFDGLNLLPLDYQPGWTMLQFYEGGKPVRKWTLSELVPNLGKLKRTISHYEWGECIGFDAKGLYEVRTVDRGTLRFDPRSGGLTR